MVIGNFLRGGSYRKLEVHAKMPPSHTRALVTPAHRCDPKLSMSPFVGYFMLKFFII